MSRATSPEDSKLIEDEATRIAEDLSQYVRHPEIMLAILSQALSLSIAALYMMGAKKETLSAEAYFSGMGDTIRNEILAAGNRARSAKKEH